MNVEKIVAFLCVTVLPLGCGLWLFRDEIKDIIKEWKNDRMD